MRPTVKLLTEARDLLDRRGGWMKNQFWNHDRSKFCAVGALRYVGGSDSPYRDPYVRGFHTARNMLDLAAHEFGTDDIVEFNDFSRTRKKDILAVYDRAIEMAGEK